MRLLGFFNLTPTEIGAIILAGLLLFGGKLPDMARNVGKTLREFKQGMSETEDERKKLADKSRDKNDDPHP
jgi:sec-independent protein translocase protein TatA